MSLLFPLLMVGVPLADLASLIAVGGAFGIIRTLALLILAMLLGIGLVRWQGLAVGREARASLAAGRLPMAAAFDSFCLLVAGGLFILPGFVSDALALLLLLPPVRLGLRLLLARSLTAPGAAGPWPAEATSPPWARPPAGGIDIEGEIIRADPGEPGAGQPARLAPGDPKASPADAGSGPTRDRPGVVRPDDPC